MSNHIPAPAADGDAAAAETPGSYCCECGSFGAHETRCLSCGFDFRAEGTRGEPAE